MLCPVVLGVTNVKISHTGWLNTTDLCLIYIFPMAPSVLIRFRFTLGVFASWMLNTLSSEIDGKCVGRAVCCKSPAWILCTLFISFATFWPVTVIDVCNTLILPWLNDWLFKKSTCLISFQENHLVFFSYQLGVMVETEWAQQPVWLPSGVFPLHLGFTQCGYQLWDKSKVTGGHCFHVHRQPYCQCKGLLDYSLLNPIKLYKQGQQYSIGCDVILVQYSVCTNLLTLGSHAVQHIVLPLCAT